MAGDQNSKYDQPAADQIEISLFGPGFGESLVVHYGDGRWLTVDSCLEDDRKTPSALKYLKSIDFSPKNCVSHVVLTHSDGDHIGGISKLFDVCKSAKLICPCLLDDRRMAAYATYHAQTDPTPLTRTTRELVDLLKLCGSRPPKSPIFVKQDSLIISERDLKVIALAPNDLKVEKFLTRVSLQIPKLKSDRRAPGKLQPNDTSVALLFETNNFSAIFGADLEETPGQGWTTVLNSSIAFQGASAARAFKVAHHGSKNADCPALWQTMEKPIAFLAPIKNGSNKIPTPQDAARIQSYTNTAYSTSSFKTQREYRLGRVDKVLGQHGMRRRDLFPKNGHIRIRVAASGEISTDLFQNAVHISQVN